MKGIFYKWCSKVALFVFITTIAGSLSMSAKEVTIGKLKYKVNTTDKIAKCSGLAEEPTKNYNLVIPNTVEYNGVTLKVTAVEKDAFWFDNYLKKVTLSDYTETIGSRAFASCDNISIVSLGKKLKIIGSEAFAHCGNNGTFTSVNLPSSVEIIRDHAFMDCRSLVSVTLGDKVQSIGDYGFWNCEALTSFIFPGSLNSIGEMAFASCDALYEVSFKSGNGKTVIGAKCFDNLKSLAVVNFLGPGVAEIGPSAFINCRIEWLSLPTSVHTVGEAAFCSNRLTFLELTEGLKIIGDYAFEDQYGVGLRALDIPSSVTSIGKHAFYSVGELETIQCKALTPPAYGEEAFSINPLRFADLWVPQASLPLYLKASGWKEFYHINNVATSVELIETETIESEEEWFDLRGNCINPENISAGIYIVRRGESVVKRVISSIQK
ncbi:MAG: leucine-rich repeat domain-containing protein [Muribaculaceae bacterium]|nr:leucine-rich repeat domain-containing protein [Muribaculaceae bacterium]